MHDEKFIISIAQCNLLFLFCIILLRISKQQGQINDLPKGEEIHDGYQTKFRKSNTWSVKELIVDSVSITNPTDLPDKFNEQFLYHRP